jgi:hypothetical protein
MKALGFPSLAENIGRTGRALQSLFRVDRKKLLALYGRFRSQPEDSMDPTQAKKQRKLTSQKVDPTKPAAIIINGLFAGLTNFCALTGYPTSTAHGWTVTGFIPPRWHGQPTHPHILKVGIKAGIAIEPAHFVEQSPKRQRRAAPAAEAVAVEA